jgi:hypothetical protein
MNSPRDVTDKWFNQCKRGEERAKTEGEGERGRERNLERERETEKEIESCQVIS